MRRLILTILLVGSLSHQTALGADAPTAADLGWLEGRWSGTKDGTTSEEHWTSPAGGALVGMHKDVKAGKMAGFEFQRIEPAKEGGLVYQASPQGRPATPFKLIESAGRRVVFENKEHDFPQRILYWLDAQGALHARIEGTMQGKAMQEEWVWTKSR
jgi:hypothetical protein